MLQKYKNYIRYYVKARQLSLTPYSGNTFQEFWDWTTFLGQVIHLHVVLRTHHGQDIEKNTYRGQYPMHTGNVLDTTFSGDTNNALCFFVSMIGDVGSDHDEESHLWVFSVSLLQSHPQKQGNGKWYWVCYRGQFHSVYEEGKQTSKKV